MTRGDHVPHRRFGRDRATVVAGAVVLLTVLAGVPGPSATIGTSARTPTAVHVENPHAVGPSVAASVAHPVLSTVPVGNRVYEVGASAPIGLLAPGSMTAFDNASGTMYAVTATGFLSAFDVGNATARNAADLLPTAPSAARVVGLAFDGIDARLFVSVDYGPQGWVWALDPATFHLLHNLSAFPSGFTPWRLTFETNSSRLVVWNVSDGSGTIVSAVVINPASYALLHSWSFACPTSSCSIPAGGITDVPSQNLLIVTFRNAYLALFNPENFSTATAPVATGWSTTVTAFDPTDSVWLITNGSYPVSQVAEVALSSFYPLGVTRVYGIVQAPADISAGLWDGADGYFVAAGTNRSTGNLSEELLAYSPTETLLGNWTAPTTDAAGYPGAVYLESGGAPTHLVAIAAAGQNGSRQFALRSAAPYFAPLQTYPDMAFAASSVGVDAAHGVTVSFSSPPLALRGWSTSTWALLWTDLLPPTTCAGTLAVDARLGRVYLPTCVGSVLVFNSTTGQTIGELPTPGNAGGHFLFVDTVHDKLFEPTNTARNITVFDLNGTLGTYAGTIVPPPGPISYGGVALDPAADRVWFGVNYSGTGGSAELFNESTLAWVRNVSTPGANMYNVASDQAGRIYLENTIPGTVGVYNELSDRWGPNLTAAGALALGAYTAAPDSSQLWLNVNSSGVLLFNVSSGARIGGFDLPYRWQWGSWPVTSAWDAVERTYVTGVLGGMLGWVHEVPLPTVPTGLAATGSNRSVSLSWSASTGVAGFPIVSYSVQQAGSAAGPWTSVANPASPSAVVPGLSNGQQYFFRVEAVSAAGLSGYSAPASATPAAAPYPPTNVTATVLGQDRVAVNWSAPVNSGGSPITGYTVRYTTNPAGTWSTWPAGTALNATVSGLAAGTTYYVEVVATNAIGTSSPSALRSASTSSAPANGAGLLGGSPYLWVAVAVVLLAVAVLALLLLRRRGRAAPVAPPAAWTPPPGSTAPPPGATAPPTGTPGSPDTPSSPTPPSAPGAPPA